MPALHRLRPREIEHLPGARSRVASVGETGDHPGAFIHEGQGGAVAQPLEFCGRVTPGLLLNRRDLLAPVFRLGLDHADGFPVDEEHVVGRAGICLIFTDGDAESGAEVDFRLDLPAGLFQHRVDGVARLLFGGPVLVRHCVGHSAQNGRRWSTASPLSPKH